MHGIITIDLDTLLSLDPHASDLIIYLFVYVVHTFGFYEMAFHSHRLRRTGYEMAETFFINICVRTKRISHIHVVTWIVNSGKTLITRVRIGTKPEKDTEWEKPKTAGRLVIDNGAINVSLRRFCTEVECRRGLIQYPLFQGR